MSFTLRMTIAGLFGLVPTSKDGRRAMYVLLIDATEPGQASSGEAHSPHNPFLTFRLADLESSTAPFSTAAGGALGQWRLDGDDLEFEFEGGEPAADLGLETLGSRSGSLERPASIQGRKDFRWIPDLGVIFPSGGVSVEPDCLTSDDFGRINLRARLLLTSGVIGSDPSSLTSETVTFVPVTGDAPADPRAQVVSDRALYEIVIDSDTFVTQSAVKISSRQKGTSITLKPSLGNAVEILLENMGIDAQTGPSTGQPIGDRVKDTDFELVYRIAAPAPAQLLVPNLHVSDTLAPGLADEHTKTSRCFACVFNEAP